MFTTFKSAMVKRNVRQSFFRPPQKIPLKINAQQLAEFSLTLRLNLLIIMVKLLKSEKKERSALEDLELWRNTGMMNMQRKKPFQKINGSKQVI